MQRFHKFIDDISGVELPAKFTFPFNYVPHALCVKAVEQIKNYVSCRDDFRDDLAEGKMFGVLVVKSSEGDLGFLAGFSGLINGSNNHDYFVPAVYDMLDPNGYFKTQEAVISGVNREIETLENSEEFLSNIATIGSEKQNLASELSSAQEEYKESKKLRKQERALGVSDERLKQMVAESQSQKGNLGRLKQKIAQKLSDLELLEKQNLSLIESLKEKRKKMSFELQQWLFTQFTVLNARGESRDLLDIFANTALREAPAGAGECAAPKMMQYAYQNGFKPIAMAEFWWGESQNSSSVRVHGNFYPSCKGKCEPILNFMMQGLEVDENPLKNSGNELSELEIMYEDADFVVVNKPSGLLSTPGKCSEASVFSLVQKMYPEKDFVELVHRLDMPTSGLLLVAFDKDVHKNLQAQFAERRIVKRYVAVLDGELEQDAGVVDLPMCLDFFDRPRQKVDIIEGKSAVTSFKVLKRENGRTLINFYPKTGRTHQLRLHSAHSEGLNMPILGDNLYGKTSDRLYLHAEYLKFKHPKTNSNITVCKPCPFGL